MKLKQILLIAIALTLANIKSTAQVAPEITPTLAESKLFKVLDILATNKDLLSTNKVWTFIPYASHAKGLLDKQGKKAEWGGGIALLHPIGDSDYFRGGFRLQSLGGDIVMPSVNAQLQSSYQLYGTKAIVTPFGFTGAAVMSGGSSQNSELGLLYGIGLNVKYPITDKLTVGVGWAVEDWSNLNVGQVDHYFLSLSWGW